MKPSARIQASIELLQVIANPRVPMDACIGDYMRNRRYIGSKDRHEIVTRVCNIVRHYARLGWWVERSGLEDTPRTSVLLWLALGEGLKVRRIRDLCDASQHAPLEVTEQERRALEVIEGQDIEHADMPLFVRTECPENIAPKLQDFFGSALEEEMRAMQVPAALDLRVNVFLKSRDEVQKSLKQDGVETQETPYSPWGLRCENKTFISKTKAFNKGWIEIQDEGSQMIAALCEAKPGMQVLDYCAGGGGKTLALAAAMMRKGRIVAMDTDAARLEKGKARFKKAWVSDIIEVRPLSDEKHRKWLKRQKESFDVVLLDVPCSGTGTWRRNPDMRWNTYGPSLDELKTVQADILEKTFAVVKPGGRLVYATCSLLREENEDQVEAFLANHPEFEVKPVDPALGNPYLRLTPHRHNTDGFFAAVLAKK